MRKIYIVQLSDEERAECKQVIKKLKGSSTKVRRAQILLKVDIEGAGWTDRKTAVFPNITLKFAASPSDFDKYEELIVNPTKKAV